RIEDAAAAHRENHSQALLLAEAHSFAHKAQPWIGHDAAQVHPFDSGSLERRDDSVVEPRGLHAAAAVVQQDSLRVRGSLRADARFRAPPENNFRGIPEIEIVHSSSWSLAK